MVGGCQRENNMENILTVKKTDTLVVRFVPLPITGIKLEFLVQIVEPLVFVPSIRSLGVMDMFEVISNNTEDCLKAHILRHWKEQLFDIAEDSDLGWLKNINKVQLIECELLTPIRKD